MEAHAIQRFEHRMIHGEADKVHREYLDWFESIHDTEDQKAPRPLIDLDDEWQVWRAIWLSGSARLGNGVVRLCGDLGIPSPVEGRALDSEIEAIDNDMLLREMEMANAEDPEF